MRPVDGVIVYLTQRNFARSTVFVFVNHSWWGNYFVREYEVSQAPFILSQHEKSLIEIELDSWRGGGGMRWGRNTGSLKTVRAAYAKSTKKKVSIEMYLAILRSGYQVELSDVHKLGGGGGGKALTMTMTPWNLTHGH